MKDVKGFQKDHDKRKSGRKHSVALKIRQKQEHIQTPWSREKRKF